MPFVFIKNVGWILIFQTEVLFFTLNLLYAYLICYAYIAG